MSGFALLKKTCEIHLPAYCTLPALGTRVYENLRAAKLTSQNTYKQKKHLGKPWSFKVTFQAGENAKKTPSADTVSWIETEGQTPKQACSRSNTSASPSNGGSSVDAKYISALQGEFSCSPVIWEYGEGLMMHFSHRS